jgi:hypothetical protein
MDDILTMEDLQTIDVLAGVPGAVPTAGDSDPNMEGEEGETASGVINARTPDPTSEAGLNFSDLPVPKIPSGVCSPGPAALRVRISFTGST